MQDLPKGFVFLKNIDSTIIESSRYFTAQNFLGRQITGYKTNNIVCTKEAGEKLKLAHSELKLKGYHFVVYDGYRPQRAVDEFIRWGKDESDNIAKAYYYPTLDKKDLFRLGYLSGKNSSHSSGSTFDLTIIKSNQKLKSIDYSKRKLLNGDEIIFLDDNTIDMGSSFDLFHEISHHDSNLIESGHTKMRNLLRDIMKKYGFKEYKEEWWHYTLENEPYPDTYFDFIV